MGPLLVGADWRACCQAIYRGIEGSDWMELYDCYTEMSRAAGVKRPNESQKARARWKMKAPNDRERISMIQNAKTTFWEEINKTRLELWEEHFKYPIVALDKSF